MAKDATVDPRVTRTRHAVLAAAREVLLDEGWEGVTLGRVAERSGYARTTLYRHWPQRLDLLRDLIREEARLAHTTPTGNLRDDLVAELEAANIRALWIDAPRDDWSPVVWRVWGLDDRFRTL